MRTALTPAAAAALFPDGAAVMLAVAGGFWIGLLSGSGSQTGLLALTLAAIQLDFGVTANGVLGQRAIYALDAVVRGRLNGLYMATFFAGAAAGSAFGGWAYARGGWLLMTGIGLVPVLLALLALSIEQKEDSRCRSKVPSSRAR